MVRFTMDRNNFFKIKLFYLYFSYPLLFFPIQRIFFKDHVPKSRELLLCHCCLLMHLVAMTYTTLEYFDFTYTSRSIPFILASIR